MKKEHKTMASSRGREEDPIMMASSRGREEDIKYLESCILTDPDVINHKDRTGATPLHNAIRYGRLALVKCLIAKGANVNVTDINGLINSPLFIAAGYCHEKIVDLLISKGANVNLANNMGRTPLWEASSQMDRDDDYVIIVNLLISNGANVNHADNYGNTPLYMASLRGNLKIVGALLFNGAVVDQRIIDVSKNEEIAKLLKRWDSKSISQATVVDSLYELGVLNDIDPESIRLDLPGYMGELKVNPDGTRKYEGGERRNKRKSKKNKRKSKKNKRKSKKNK